MGVLRPILPPMGWNSWDCYGASVTEEEVIGNAEYMARHLKEYGWEYVVVDIQWYEPTADGSQYHAYADVEMDQWGRLLPAVNRFPSASGGRGFGPLAQKIHALGLKFGIHILRGIPRQAVHENVPILGAAGVTARTIAHINSICPWNSDMYGLDATKSGAQAYYDSIFQLYAEWGVDFVKVDDISASTLYGYHRDEVEMISQAIERSGRAMVLSLSPGPAGLEHSLHLKTHATMWRISNDYWDQWKQLRETFDLCAAWAGVSGPGSFPDADMLPLGHIGLRSAETGVGDRWTRFTRDEQRTMMTLWCMARSPLMAGGELRDNDDWTNSLYTAPAVLGVLRSYGNHEAYRQPDASIWLARRPDDDAYYVGLFNLSEARQTVSVPDGLLPDSGRLRVRDLWEEAGEQTAVNRLSVELPPHGCQLLLVTPQE